jgi:hypothetical protein
MDSDSDRQYAVDIIKANVDSLKISITAAETFGARVPGYCPTCPSYVDNWEMTYNRKVHLEWCLYTSFFRGKSSKAIRLIRYDDDYPAFKKIWKRKAIACPLLGGEN